jgi:hypothetical protein
LQQAINPLEYKVHQGEIRFRAHMDTATEVPTVWNQLAEAMYLKDSATAEVWLSERASFRFARLQSSEGLLEVARPVVGERGYIVVLQLKAVPFLETECTRSRPHRRSRPLKQFVETIYPKEDGYGH